MPGSPYRSAPDLQRRCRNCGADLSLVVDTDRYGRSLCGACFSERYDLPALLGMISLCAGASTGSMVLLSGGLALSGLAAYAIRRWV